MIDKSEKKKKKNCTILTISEVYYKIYFIAPILYNN